MNGGKYCEKKTKFNNKPKGNMHFLHNLVLNIILINTIFNFLLKEQVAVMSLQ